MTSSYRVLVTKAGARDIERLPPETRGRLKTEIEALAEAPRAAAEKLAGQDAYRVRVGDYRFVFRVDDEAREVLVERVKHRREVYRRR
ncbi:MAG: type II toxin-antitoxin system RelE/ParE family toxin [Thermoleophilaceae bacterium]